MPRSSRICTLLCVARRTYVVISVFAVISTVERIVISMSKIFPTMMLRSFSMSNTLASTVRNDPKRRVENQTKPIELQIGSFVWADRISPSSVWYSCCAGSRRSR